MKNFEKIVQACKICVESEGCDGCPYADGSCAPDLRKDVLNLITEMKTELDRPVQDYESLAQSHSEEIRKLHDKLSKAEIVHERTQRELYEAQKELTYLRAVKATAEAFLGVKIDGQM